MIGPLKEATDEQLAELLRQHEVGALQELYQRYSKRLLRYFYRMLWQDEEKSQDLLHDLFAKLIEKPYHYQPTKKFSTWIFSVAHNMCKNEYRRQSRWEVALGRWREENANQNRVENKHPDHELFTMSFQRALQQLEPIHKTIFTLRYQENLTIREIAAVIDCSPGTVKSRIFYAKKKLAQKLKIFDPTKTQ
ncbi:MAG: RNA polymerase sigma factor [Cyclobacteriaceae bacterium]